MNHAILIHDAADDVGVAARDLKAGEEVGAVTLEGIVQRTRPVSVRSLPSSLRTRQERGPLRSGRQGTSTATRSFSNLKYVFDAQIVWSFAS